MELAEVLRKRRMVRDYDGRPVDPDVVDRVIAAGFRAPSAGFSQGFAVLVLTSDDDRARFWKVTETPQETASWPPETKASMQRVPVIVPVLSCKRIYLDRYAREDKGWTDRDEARWPVPFWHTDAAMLAMLMLLQVVDEGLGAVFIGMQPEVIPAFREAFGVPDDHDVVGVVCFGHETDGANKRDLSARRREYGELVHHGRW